MPRHGVAHGLQEAGAPAPRHVLHRRAPGGIISPAAQPACMLLVVSLVSGASATMAGACHAVPTLSCSTLSILKPSFEANCPMAVGSDRDEALVEAFHELTNNQHVEPTTIPVQMGRKLQVDKAGLF